MVAVQTWTFSGRWRGTVFYLGQAGLFLTTLTGDIWRMQLNLTSSMTPGVRQAAVEHASLYTHSTGGAALRPLRPCQFCNAANENLHSPCRQTTSEASNSAYLINDISPKTRLLGYISAFRCIFKHFYVIRPESNRIR